MRRELQALKTENEAAKAAEAARARRIDALDAQLPRAAGQHAAADGAGRVARTRSSGCPPASAGDLIRRRAGAASSPARA